MQSGFVEAKLKTSNKKALRKVQEDEPNIDLLTIFCLRRNTCAQEEQPDRQLI